MPESYRTSIRFTKILWNLIDSSIGILGYNRSDVIGWIIQSYFHNVENLNTINLLKEERAKYLRHKQKERVKEPEVLQKKLMELLENANNIPLKTATEYLQIELDFFFENLNIWAKTINFRIENDKIVKIDGDNNSK